MTNFISIRQTAQPSGLLFVFSKPRSNSNHCLVYFILLLNLVLQKSPVAALLEIQQHKELERYGCFIYQQHIVILYFVLRVTTFRGSATSVFSFLAMSINSNQTTGLKMSNKRDNNAHVMGHALSSSQVFLCPQSQRFLCD